VLEPADATSAEKPIRVSGCSPCRGAPGYRRSHLSVDWARNGLASPLALIVLQAMGLWPIWHWYGRRLVDGLDESWGLLALAAVLLLLWGHRGNFRPEPRPGPLFTAGMLTLLSAGTGPWLHMLPRAVLGVSAIGLTLAAVLDRPRSILPLWCLLALSLPVFSSMQLQLYLGYPLRAFTAWASKEVLAIAGLKVAQTGTALTWMGRTVLVDAPCSGIRMLWVGMLLAALLSYFTRASASRFVLNQVIAFPIILAGNVLRNTLLFVREAGILQLPTWTHTGIGLLAFLLTSLVIVACICRRPHACSSALCGNDPGRRHSPHADSCGTASVDPDAGRR